MRGTAATEQAILNRASVTSYATSFSIEAPGSELFADTLGMKQGSQRQIAVDVRSKGFPAEHLILYNRLPARRQNIEGFPLEGRIQYTRA